MTTLNLLLELHAMCRFRSTEGQAELSKSELKRWCDENNCYTMPDGECISPGPCFHNSK